MGQMKYKAGVDKKQITLFPTSLDDYISKEHICRVINAFTGQLDMSALDYTYAEVKSTGCRPYDPRMMLNLYLYGYLHRVRSSRRLQAETTRNVEVMWLLDGLKPDDRTICNFRKDNAKALRETFRVFAVLCRDLGLYGGEVVATDSTKFRANNSRKNNWNKTTVDRQLTRIDKQISDYMNALEQADKEAIVQQAPSTEAIKAALEKLKQRKVTFEELKSRVESEGEVSTVDEDARLMRSGGDGRALDVCYNVQTVVDSKHKLIIDFDLSERSDDKGNLHTMSKKAKALLEVPKITNLADKGYYDGDDIAACESNGVRCLVAKPKPGGAMKEEGFTRTNFIYTKDEDCYICPGKNRLKYMRNQRHSDGTDCRVYANYSACTTCPLKNKCTKAKYRQVLRRPHEDTLDIVNERTQANKALYKKRQAIVEHPFGTIKAVWGYKQFLCRTKPKVSAETALAYLAYNMRRFITISIESKVNPISAFV
jgi:transposase